VDDDVIASVRASVQAAVPLAQQPASAAAASSNNKKKWPSTRALLESLLAAAEASEVFGSRSVSLPSLVPWSLKLILTPPAAYFICRHFFPLNCFISSVLYFSYSMLVFRATRSPSCSSFARAAMPSCAVLAPRPPLPRPRGAPTAEYSWRWRGRRI